MNPKVDLSRYDNPEFHPGAGKLKQLLWYFTNNLFFRSRWLPLYAPKRQLLRAFGAKVGQGVVIKPAVNIKYPWRLVVGDYSWIGEECWIDNLADVQIGAHCVLSQGCLLLTGNHNFKSPAFDLLLGEITLQDGVWIGARGLVAPGVHCGTHAILSAGSVATKHLEPWWVYQGNPAKAVRKRVLQGSKNA